MLRESLSLPPSLLCSLFNANQLAIHSLLDMIYAVRSDESTHRFVNNTLASLKPQDVNPFALGEPGMRVKGAKFG